MSDRPTDTVVRTFETVSDRQANTGVGANQPRQRSFSIERRYRSGSVDRVHVHNNLHNGNHQFEHTIGHTDRTGTYTGRQN